MTNIRVSWKAIFAQLNFLDFNKKATEIKVHKKSSQEKKKRISLL